MQSPRWPFLLVLLAATVMVPTPRALSAPLARLLPSSTRLYIATPNFPNCLAAWRQTQLARVWDEPTVRDFFESAGGSRSEAAPPAWQALGLEWDDLQAIASGAAGFAVIEWSEGAMVDTLLIETSGREAAVAKLRAVIDQRYARRGATRRVEAHGDGQVTVFDVPAGPAASGRRAPRCFLWRPGLFGTTSRVDSAFDLLDRHVGNRVGKNCLSESPTYQQIIAASDAAAGDQTPQIRWYVDPFGLERLVQGQIDPESQAVWQRARTQGFDVLKAMGGRLVFAAGPFGLLHHTVVCAPLPYTKAARMLQFPGQVPVAPPNWVPADVGRYTCFVWDLPAALTGYGSWFDATYGEGEQGVFDDVLLGIRDDPDGPGVDIRRLLRDHVHGPLHFVRSRTPRAVAAGGPAASHAADWLFGLPVSDAPSATRAVRQLLEGDPDVTRQTIGTHVVWQFRDLVASPGSTPLEEPEELIGPDLSNVAICVTGEYLLVATHIDFLRKFLRGPEEADQLRTDRQFQAVIQHLGALGSEHAVLTQFARPSGYLDGIDAGRQASDGRGPRTAPAQLVAALIGRLAGRADSSEPPAEEIDGDAKARASLAKIRTHLGPSGSVAKKIDLGWLWIGFTLDQPVP